MTYLLTAWKPPGLPAQVGNSRNPNFMGFFILNLQGSPKCQSEHTLCLASPTGILSFNSIPRRWVWRPCSGFGYSCDTYSLFLHALSIHFTNSKIPGIKLAGGMTAVGDNIPSGLHQWAQVFGILAPTNHDNFYCSNGMPARSRSTLLCTSNMFHENAKIASWSRQPISAQLAVQLTNY